MTILEVGSDARTHMLTRKLRSEGHSVICAPGNDGIFYEPGVVTADVKPEDHARLISLADMTKAVTIVLPEGPLVAGIGDEFRAVNRLFFGPSRAGAMLEGSKAYCCETLAKAGVPMGKFWIFDDPEDAIHFLEKITFPIVIKADGLCAGKGVRILWSLEEGIQAVTAFMVDKIFKESGARIIFQEFLNGYELSMFAIRDKNGFVLYTIFSQDHKPVNDGNKGPMTGGMGAFAPVSLASTELWQLVIDRIFTPTFEAVEDYEGILYAGLMVTDSGPKVLEYNCRFGDPETEVVLPLLKTNLGETIQAAAEGELERIGKLKWHDGACYYVGMTVEGYPDAPVTGDVISGLDDHGQLACPPDHDGEIWVLHAGTERVGGVWKTKGGRALGVGCKAQNHKFAFGGAYKGVERISWRGEHHRNDIGIHAAA